MIYYNPIIFKKLLFNDSLLENEYNIFYLNRASICKFDRSKLFNKFNINEKYNFKSIYDLPDYSKTQNLSFEELCFARAKEIVENYDTFSLNWSGGLDSSVILLSLNEYNVLDKLKVVLTENSIRDNPLIYNNVVKKYDHVVCKDFVEVQSNHSLNHINITGDGSECIYGWSGILQSTSSELGISAIYTKLTDIPKMKNKVSQKNYATFDFFLKLYKSIEETLPACPIEIVDIQDLNWWFVHNFCFQYDALRLVVPYFKNYKKAWEMLLPFFMTDEFQVWFVKNYYELSKGKTDFNNYKIDQINFIKKYYGEIDFSQITPRKTNVEFKTLAPTDFLMIDDNYDLIPAPEFLKPTKKELLSAYSNRTEQEIQMLFD